MAPSTTALVPEPDSRHQYHLVFNKLFQSKPRRAWTALHKSEGVEALSDGFKDNLRVIHPQLDFDTRIKPGELAEERRDHVGCDRQTRAEPKFAAQFMLGLERSFHPGECVLNFGRKSAQGVTVRRQFDAARRTD